MTHWHTRRMVPFDTETTGTDPHRDRIVSAAVLEVGGGQPTRTTEWLLNPGIPIPEQASAVHGITDEDVADRGVDPADGVREIAETLLHHVEQGRPVVGHNVVYDLTVLWSELLRYGHGPLATLIRGIRPVIDTQVIEKHLDPFRPGSPERNRGRRPDEACGTHSLLDCCRLWGVPLDEVDAHGAAADALAAGRLAWKLATNPLKFAQYDGAHPIERINPGLWPADELHRWQAETYAASAARYQRYRRGLERSQPAEGADPTFVAPTGWPVQDPPEGWTPEQLPERESVA